MKAPVAHPRKVRLQPALRDEAMDRTYVAGQYLQNFLLEHQQIASKQNLRVKIVKAQKLLFEVYQALGDEAVKSNFK